MLELFSLKGKVALVTGASRGLGNAIARGLAGAGAHVVLVARDRLKLETLRDEIIASGGMATATPIDLEKEDDIRAGVRKASEECGGIDICVNNAGIINWQPLVESELQDFEKIINTNVRATFIMAQECAAQMRARGHGGRIINIGSVLGPMGRAKLHAYCSSKSAIIGLTRALAAELGKEKITVNCICPGYFMTEINASLQSRPGYIDAINGATPMERWGDPAEMVGTVIYLSAQASSFVTGQVIMVDGGLTSSFKFQLVA